MGFFVDMTLSVFRITSDVQVSCELLIVTSLMKQVRIILIWFSFTKSSHRNHDDIVFQSFCCMHGYNLDKMLITLETQLTFLNCNSFRRLLLPAEPFDQTVHAWRDR